MGLMANIEGVAIDDRSQKAILNVAGSGKFSSDRNNHE